MATNRFARLTGMLTGHPPGVPGPPARGKPTLTRREHFVHFWIHVFQSFARNRCFIRASALSFSTLLALIPMLAVAISVTSSLLKTEGEDQIYAAINKLVATLVPPATASPRHPDATANPNPAGVATISTISTNPDILFTTNRLTLAETNALTGTNAPAAATDAGGDAGAITAQKEAARSIHDFIQNTRSGTLGIIGMLALVSAAIFMLAKIEDTFNDIWGVCRGRKWLWRIVLYWAVLTLGPPALVGAASLAGSSHLDAVHHLISRTPVIGRLGFELLPLVILWLVFTLIYLTVPNTKVWFSAALVGGLVAGSLWELNNYFGYLYFSRVLTNREIYGSLGLVPVFMAGIYCSWVILLFGVQVSCAFQNREAYIQDKLAENVNQRGREFIALRLMTNLGLRYQTGQPAAGPAQIAGELGVSVRLTREILQPLLIARLITEVTGPEAAYQPARPLETINAHQVLLALRAVNTPAGLTNDEPVRDEIYGEFARIEEAERVAAAAVTLQALVNRARTRLELPPGTHPEPVRLLSSATPAPAPTATLTLTPEPIAPPAAPNRPPREFAAPGEDHDFPL
jgi:membrane protein